MSKKLIVPLQKIHGRVHTPEDAPRWLELLPPPADESEEKTAPPTVFLRYALTEMGTERPIFPAVVLDDWGNERKRLSLYRWIREEGDMFPRAEVFGYTAEWQEEQVFLRDLELHVRYPLKVYATAETPQAEGDWVRHIAIVNPAVTIVQRQPRPTKERWPTDLIPWPPFPLRLALATWWQLPPSDLASFVPA
jgi:hypothetical protein